MVLAAEDETPLRRLHAIDGADASFLAVDPRSVVEGYRCELTDADRPLNSVYPLRHVLLEAESSEAHEASAS